MIRDRDWSNHGLGPPELWPESLKTALSLILNSPESMILAWGPELSFFFNDTYFPLLGPRLPWAMGEPFEKVWADGWEQAKPIIDDAFAGRPKRFNDLPWKLETDRGQANTWFTFSYSRVLDSEGEAAGLFVFTNETTARVLADAALRESAERLRLVIEGARDHVILATDADGTILDWSVGAERILGWTKAEAVGQSASMLFTPEDREASVDIRELLTAASEGCANDERWHVTSSDGRVFLNGSVHPLPANAQGRAGGFIKIARDETQRKLRDEVRAEEAERQRLSLQQMPGFAAILIGPEHIFDYVNDAYIKISGERDFIGKSVREVFPELAGQGFYELLDGAFVSGQRFIAQALPIRLEGEESERYLDLLYQPVFDEQRCVTGIFVGGYDVTDRLRAERALADANATLEDRIDAALNDRERIEEALRQAQKMEAVGQLTGGLAHDFNNLLTAVTGGLDLLSLRITQGRIDELDRYITMAKTGANRAAALTHRLLAFSRRQTLAPTLTDVDHLIAGMHELIVRTIGPEIHVEFVSSPDLWSVLVDSPQLESALLNLCINARDAMPDGGRLTIETHNKRLDARAAELQDLIAGEYVSLCVTDTGTGMTPEIIERVFDPFFTTKPIGEGTGLGLSMIYGFVRQSGGQVRIYSEVGTGTTMCLYLPRHSGQATIGIDGELPTDERRAPQDHTVLVVEDEEAIRMLIKEVLSDAGYRTVEASTGPAGVAILQSSERIDLLVTDVGLPGGLNGRQVADAGRAIRPDLKVLFVTGYAANAAVGAGHLDKDMEVLTKPFSVIELTRKVNDILEM